MSRSVTCASTQSLALWCRTECRHQLFVAGQPLQLGTGGRTEIGAAEVAGLLREVGVFGSSATSFVRWSPIVPAAVVKKPTAVSWTCFPSVIVGGPSCVSLWAVLLNAC